MPGAVHELPASDTRGTILIVEDERIVAQDLQEMLTDLGYEVSGVVASAEEALLAVARQRPHLLLMDIRIKGPLDGIDTACILRRRFDIAVIYLTANLDDVTFARALESHPSSYLSKPIRFDALRDAIEKGLRAPAPDRCGP